MKRNFLLKITIFAYLLCLFMCCSGCKSIFEKKTDPFLQIEVSKEALQNNVFYVKDGTKFIQVYDAITEKVTDTQSTAKKSICFLTRDYKAVPVLYKDELLAIASDKASAGSIKVTRYKEIGYTFGAFGLVFDKDQYLYGNLKHNFYADSTMYNRLSENPHSEEIRIVSVNGQPITSEMITSTGIFNCLEANCSYDINYYAGTYFQSTSVNADVFMLEEYEYYTLNNAENTKNGYFAYTMPENAQSGWYYINDAGMFLYVNQPKGCDISSIDKNIPYYTSFREQEDAYSQKYSTSFDTRTQNVSLLFYYDDSDLVEESESIEANAYAPDGTCYTFTNDTENKMLVCNLEEAQAGKWTIYIRPEELKVLNMEIISNKPEQEISEEEHSILIEENGTNYYFQVNYEGNGTIYAVLVDNEGNISEFAHDNKKKTLTYTSAFIKAGTYTVKIYHYSDTNILGIETTENTNTNVDIITVTG